MIVIAWTQTLLFRPCKYKLAKSHKTRYGPKNWKIPKSAVRFSKDRKI